MPKNRTITLAAATALIAPLLITATGTAAHASTVGDAIHSAAIGQIGAGPCSNTASGSTNGDAGYYAPGTAQGNSCSHPGTASSPVDSGQTHAWCADFAGWTWNQAGVTVDSNLNDLASSFYDYGVAHGTWSSTPHVGDAVYFDSGIKAGNGHVAIVTAVNSDGTIDDVGGNEKDANGNWLVQHDVDWIKAAPDSQTVWTENGAAVHVVGYAGPAGGVAPPPPPTVTADPVSTSDSNWSVYNPDTKVTTAFGVGTTGMIGFSTGNGTAWPNWAPVAGNWGTFPVDVKPTGIYDPDTKEMMVFARQADGTMGMSQYPDKGNAWFSAWTEMSNYWKLGGQPSAVYNPDTKTMTVFARGNDNNLGFTQSVNGGNWSPWAIVNTYWGASFVGDPHAVYNPDTKQVSVFARDSAGDIGVSTSVPGGAWPWSNWAVANPFWKLAGDPSVVYNLGTKTMSLFARGNDGNLGVSSNVNGGGFSNWAIVNTYWGAGFVGTPHAVYNPDTKQVSVFARDSAGDVGVSTYVPGTTWPWSNWTVLNPWWKLTGDPAVSYNPGTKTMTAFAMGAVNHLGVTASVNGGNFSQWNDANLYWNLAGPVAN